MVKITKKIMSFCVVFMLLFSCSLGVAAADISVTATLSNAGVIAVGADTEKDNAATVMANVPVKLTGADSYTVNDVLKALHNRYYSGGSAAGYATTVNGGSVTKLWGVATTNTLFFVNGVGLTTGVGADTVADGDAVTASVNKDNTYYADWYTGFDVKTKTVAVKESFDLTLNGYLGMAYTEEDKTAAAVTGVSVGTVDATGFTALTGKTTGADGKVSLSFDKAGTYVISATGTVVTKVTDWGQSGYPKVDFNAPIIAPACVVKVEEPKVTLTVTDNTEGTPVAEEYAYAPGDTPVELTVNTVADHEGGTYAYHWRYKAAADAEEYNKAGSSSQIKKATFKQVDTSKDSLRYYYCHVTYTLNGEAYEFDSPLVKVSVIATNAMKPTIGTQPVGGTYLAATTDVKALSVAASVTDGGTLSYQWYADSGSGYEKVDGATEKKYTPFSQQAGTIKYYCLVKNSLDSISGAYYSTGIKSEVATVEFQSAASYGADWEGKGTEAAPYLLSSQADLTSLANICNDGLSFGGVYFKMTKDITLPAKWTPIGMMKAGSEPAKPFGGIFDGNRKTLTVPEDGLPLLGFVRGAVVKNLNIYGTKIASNGLVAYYAVDSNVNRTVDIINCTLKAGSSTLYSGFIGGYASGVNTITFRDCTVEKNVVIGYDAQQSSIGSFGGDFNGYANGCVSYATVKGVDRVGGIIGGKGQSMGACDVHDCAFYGDVIAGGDFAGGIVGGGYLAASAPQTPCVSIRNCYATGSITGKNNVGGIFGGEGGVRETWNDGVGYVQNNYFAGTVKASAEDGVSGGVIGYMRSLGRYNIISNNFYVDSCGADQGIGKAESVTTLDTPAVTEGSGFTAVKLAAGTVYGRDDDPMGADAKALAAPFAKDSLADGTLLAKLNAGVNSSGDWVQGSAYPEFGGKRHLLTITCSALAAMSGVSEKVGADLMDGKELTLTYSDGSTETVSAKRAVRKYASTNNTMAGTTVADSLTYSNHQLVFKLDIKEGTDPTPGDLEDGITVSFTLLGDSAHAESATIHSLKGGNLKTWIGKTDVTVAADATVMDVFAKALNKAGYSWYNDDVKNSVTGNYIQSITMPDGLTLAEFTNGTNSGWMYTLNDKHPLLGVKEQVVADGDVIVFHYTDDYTVEEDDGNTDELTAKTVAAAINALPAAKDCTLADESAVKAARAAYDDLTEEQQDLISSRVLNKLLGAEKALAALKTAAADEAAAKAVRNGIDALPAKITLSDQDAVAAVRTAYNSLSAAQKELVTNLNKLTAAEDAIKSLEALKQAIEKLTDVADGQWFYDDVAFCLEKGIMKGTSSTTFGPDDNITRGQFVTVLGRYQGIKDAKAESPSQTKFDDVNATKYYASHVAWAAEKGIVFGTSENTFEPNAKISREDMATMMLRFAKVAGISLPDGSKAAAFDDDGKIAKYAKTAVYSMKEAKIINGKGDNLFDPKADATRAEAAHILHLLLKYNVK